LRNKKEGRRNVSNSHWAPLRSDNELDLELPFISLAEIGCLTLQDNAAEIIFPMFQTSEFISKPDSLLQDTGSAPESNYM
jgi:hypothetical protein